MIRIIVQTVAEEKAIRQLLDSDLARAAHGRFDYTVGYDLAIDVTPIDKPPATEFIPAAPTLSIGDVKTCDCGAAIFFAMTASGRPMPARYDSAGDPAGNLAVWRAGGKLRCRVLRKDEPCDDHEIRYSPHFADCPNAQQHRRR